MSRFASVLGSHWPGYDGLKKLFIFGDSYSSVGYDTGWPAPTEAEPLGVPFPGYTWTEGGEEDMGDSTGANWVGHLVLSRKKDAKSLLVYDYAVGGDTLAGVKKQIELWYLPNVGKKPDWAPWEANDSLFVTWVGINDCARSGDHIYNIQNLYELQETLYKSGARNFLLIDVPPIHQSPALASITPEFEVEASKTYRNWNNELHNGAESFRASHPDITLLMYSSWDIFNKVNSDPEAFGFRKSDLKKRAGAIWFDYLHPTTKMHGVIARDFDAFMKGFQNAGGES
ncbi:hypothetical protein M0805_008670 [Coniferiporia weirii]|nr:hypothetical protein M0805_008670 [Coniferiporia weirii]